MLSVIGLGYVGLVTAVGLGLKGHRVIGIDTDAEKIEKINAATSPLYEEGIDEAIRRIELIATRNYDEILSSDITFVCVNTSSNSDISVNLTQLKKSIRQSVEVLSQKKAFHLLVVRSTVTPGTTEEVIVPLLPNSGNIGICLNPEFFREGMALDDFMHPSRIIIGENNTACGDILSDLYQGFGCPSLRTDFKTAEMIKCASNSFLATKISFINEIGNICKRMSIDAYEVAKGIGYDERIGDKFLNAGVGFGGSCLPKDLMALVTKSKEEQYESRLLREVLRLNEEQPQRMVELLRKHIPSLKGRVIGILGLAFKPNTDDVRNSRAVPIIRALLKEGARIKAYDPVAMTNFKQLFPQIEYANPAEVLRSDATLIVTEWDEFYYLDYSNSIVIDGRRILKAKEARIYEGVCW